jgi:TetR/AcrR family transcriptional regulator, transcriptional repressor of bet genes
MPGQRAPEEARREQIVKAAYEVALRTGITGVTLRAVAAEAGLSHGLVLFHFKRKDEVIGALLDRVLATTAILQMSEDAGRLPPRAPHRLDALLLRELKRLAHDPRGMRLFFEYWALGVRQTAIRQKIAAALERYRAAFRSLAEETLPHDTPPGAAVTPDALAAVAVSLINGCAVQMMIDPDRFDTEAYRVAVRTLVGRLVPAASEVR